MFQGVYSHPVRLYYNDFDRYGNLRMSTLLHILSDIAGVDYKQRGYSYEWMKERNQVFLLSAFRIAIHSYPECDETVKVETWEHGNKGAAYLRCFRILREDGSLMLEAFSNWLLVDPISRKLLRPKDFVGETMPIERDFSVEPPQRIKVDPSEMEFWTDRVIRFTDMDRNDHVYNAKYADMIWDALPQECNQDRVADFQIHYKQEAVLNEVLKIGYRKNEDGFLVLGLHRDSEEICFAAKIRLYSEAQ